jgi:hypothetical protein
MSETIIMPKQSTDGSLIQTSIRPDIASVFNITDCPLMTFHASTSHSLDNDSTIKMEFSGWNVLYKGKIPILRQRIEIPIAGDQPIKGLIRDIDYSETGTSRITTITLASEKILFDTHKQFNPDSSGVINTLRSLAKLVHSSVHVVGNTNPNSVHWNTPGNVFSCDMTQTVIEQMKNLSTVSTGKVKGSDFIFRIYFDLHGNLNAFPYDLSGSKSIQINYNDMNSIINSFTVKTSEKSKQKYQYYPTDDVLDPDAEKPNAGLKEVIVGTYPKNNPDTKVFETVSGAEKKVPDTVYKNKYAFNNFVHLKLNGLHWGIKPHSNLNFKNFPWVKDTEKFIIKSITYTESATSVITEIIAETPGIIPLIYLKLQDKEISDTEKAKPDVIESSPLGK